MNRVLTSVLLLVVAVVSLALAQTSVQQTGQGQTNTNRSGAAQQKGGVEQQLIQLDKDWSEAGRRGDIAALERILATDYVSTSGATGRSVTRAETLADVRANAGGQNQDTVSYDDYAVQVYGDAAVLTHRTTVNTQENNQPVTFQVRSMHVFVKKGGRWQAVYSQGTRIAPPSTAQPQASPSPAAQPQTSPTPAVMPQTSPTPAAAPPQASPSPAATPPITFRRM
jgi:ketosteroid isomerase-like protein